MKKNWKKIVLFSLAAVLIILLTACSSIDSFLAKIGLKNNTVETTGGGIGSIGLAPTGLSVTCLALDLDGNIRLAPSGEAAAATVSVEVQPAGATNKTVNFSSSKTAVFTCNKTGPTSCDLMAIGTGVATLTVTAEADTSVKAQITVKVEEVNLISIGFANNDGTYAIGKSFTLRPLFTPVNAIDKSVVFTSSDESIATVNSEGLVSTLAAGTSNITVKSATNQEIFAVYSLTVADYSTALLPKRLEVDGLKNEGAYFPVLYWDEMAGGGDVTVEISKNGVSTLCNKSTHGNYFGYGRFVVPASVATLEEGFYARAKYSSENTWTEYVEYKKYIGTDFSYFDSVYGDVKINRYFNSLLDMSETLVFFCTFEPAGFETFAKDGFGHEYDFEINITTGYTAEDIGYTEGSADEINRLLTEVTSLSPGGLGASISFNGIAGDRNLKIRIISDSVPTSAFPVSTPSANKPEHAANEMCDFEGVTRAPTFEGFATEDVTKKSVAVETGEELLWAVENGMRPIATPESTADNIYRAAKDVLRNIIKVTMTERDKIHAIYDWLALNITYDTDLLNSVMANPSLASAGYYSKYYDFYLESVFLSIPGISVCDGISKAFSLLAAMEGIDAVRVIGSASAGENNVAHAWNKVRINGCWYVVDATWASKAITLNSGGETVMDNEFISHAYLFGSDAIFTSHHEDEKIEYPAANDYINVFYGKNNYFETEADFETYVASQLKTEYDNSRPAGVLDAKRYAAVEIYFDAAGWNDADFIAQSGVSSAFTNYFGNCLNTAGFGSGYIYTAKLISERYILLIIQER